MRSNTQRRETSTVSSNLILSKSDRGVCAMDRSIVAAALVVSAATTLHASLVGLSLTIDGESATQEQINVPKFFLTNTSTAQDLVMFTLTVGDTAFGFDDVYCPTSARCSGGTGFSAPAGGTMVASGGTSTIQGAPRPDFAEFAFTDFDPGEVASWRMDIDSDNANDFVDFRSILIGNGAATPNAVATVKFGNGQVVTFTLPETPGVDTGTTARYTFEASVVPVPAPVALLLSALGGMALLRRRG